MFLIWFVLLLQFWNLPYHCEYDFDNSADIHRADSASLFGYKILWKSYYIAILVNISSRNEDNIIRKC